MSDVRKVLITGGAGFIGSHIAEHFAPRCEVVVLDDLRSGFERNLDGLDVRLVKGSVNDRALVHELARGADFIFNHAAVISVPESMEKPWECVEVNVGGTLNVLEAARAHGVRKVVHASSCSVYGDDPALPKREDMVPGPLSPYGVTKLDGEYYMAMYHRQYGVGTVSLRYFNVYGPRQDPGSQYAPVVPIFIKRALADEDLTVYGDGEQTRDFIYVKDIVEASAMAAASDMTGTYNVARGEHLTVNETAQTIIRKLGSSSKIVHRPERAGDIKHSYADISRLRAAGFEPRVSLEQGLSATIEFFTRTATV